MKKLVFYYLFVGLPALLMLVSTSRTIIEYGSFPFTGSLLSQKFYFNWCLLMCSVILRDIKSPRTIRKIVPLYTKHTRGQKCDYCTNGYCQREQH